MTDIARAQTYIRGAQVLLAEAQRALDGSTPTPPADVIDVAAGTPLQPLIDGAPAGVTLRLAAGRYAGSLQLAKAITIRPQADVPPGRTTEAGYGVELLADESADAVTVTGADVTLCGLVIKGGHKDRQGVAFTGQRLWLDRCTVLGSPTTGLHRGVMLNGAGARLTGCYVDYCFDFGRDTQAVSGWDGTRDVEIDDCYLSGAGETILWGGGDSSSPERMPAHIRITRSTLTKRAEWYDMGAQIKNAYEIKAGVDVVMEDCILEHGGKAEGQGGYVVLFSVRNQDGAAPWSTVQHCRISRCRVQYGGSGIKFSGQDDNFPSTPMDDVVLDQVMMTDIGPAQLGGGDARGVLFVNGPVGVTLQNVTVQGEALASTLYMLKPYSSRLTLSNVKLGDSAYGMKLEEGGAGVDAWQDAMPDAAITMTPEDTGATDYPGADHD